MKRLTVVQGIYQNLQGLTFLIFFTDSTNYNNVLTLEKILGEMLISGSQVQIWSNLIALESITPGLCSHAMFNLAQALVTSKFLLFRFFPISVHTLWSAVWSPKVWKYFDILDDYQFYYWMHWKRTHHIKKTKNCLSQRLHSYSLGLGFFFCKIKPSTRTEGSLVNFENFFFLMSTFFEYVCYISKRILLAWYFKPKHWLQ